MSPSPQPVLLYDGECGLCNAIIRFMLRRDRRGVLKFAPLQGEIGQAFLRSRGMDTEDFDSLVLIEDFGNPDTGHRLRTAGALGGLQELGGAWRRFAKVALWIPAFARDAVYRLIAKTRYRLFGRYAPRPMPAEWAGRFLD